LSNGLANHILRSGHISLGKATSPISSPAPSRISYVKQETSIAKDESITAPPLTETDHSEDSEEDEKYSSSPVPVRRGSRKLSAVSQAPHIVIYGVDPEESNQEPAGIPEIAIDPAPPVDDILVMVPTAEAENKLGGGLGFGSLTKSKLMNSVRDIIQELRVKKDDEAAEDEDGHQIKGQWSDSKENPFEKYFATKINELIEVYYEKVTYLQESWLCLLFLIPFILVITLLPYCISNEFSDVTAALITKGILASLGIFAVSLSEIINQRHADLNTIAKIIDGEGTVQTICKHVKRKTYNRTLRVFGSAIELTS
jgi:hypothetical protein